jgi:hypothetical protein
MRSREIRSLTSKGSRTFTTSGPVQQGEPERTVGRNEELVGVDGALILETLGFPAPDWEFTAQRLPKPSTMPTGSAPTATRASTSMWDGAAGVVDGEGDDLAASCVPPQAPMNAAIARRATTDITWRRRRLIASRRYVSGPPRAVRGKRTKP